MKLLEFINKYPDENACKKAFKGIREQRGVTCKKCGHTTQYRKSDKWSRFIGIRSVNLEQHFVVEQ